MGSRAVADVQAGEKLQVSVPQPSSSVNTRCHLLVRDSDCTVRVLENERRVVESSDQLDLRTDGSLDRVTSVGLGLKGCRPECMAVACTDLHSSLKREDVKVPVLDTIHGWIVTLESW